MVKNFLCWLVFKGEILEEALSLKVIQDFVVLLTFLEENVKPKYQTELRWPFFKEKIQ